MSVAPAPSAVASGTAAPPPRPSTYLPTSQYSASSSGTPPSHPPHPSPHPSSHHRLSANSPPSPGPASHSAQHLDKLASVKPSGHDMGRLYTPEDKRGPHSPLSSYPGHVPKVSFDDCVKEYGDDYIPGGRGDPRDYFRGHLSGKEGSMKHRILIRPDSDEDSRGLPEEPVSKRSKFSSLGSSGSHHESSHRGERRHHSVPHNPVGQQNFQPDHDSHGQSSGYPPAPTASPPPGSSHLQYPSHFMKGSIIQLANGSLKRVEELQTEDFVNSAEISADLKVDSSTVEKIEENLEAGTAMLSFSVGEHKVQVRLIADEICLLGEGVRYLILVCQEKQC